VHGATLDAVQYAERIVEQEMNAVTDNPLVFPDEDQILSGGNFHGQPLALVLDFLAIALAELGNISERRIYLLISGQRGLPPFLVKSAGLDSGLMIAQYTAASIVSQSKQWCTPASVDSIVSSNGQEDHVSMGANAATKLYQVVNNTEKILAIELLNAAQALSFRRPLKSSAILENIYQAYREQVPVIEKDRIIHEDMQKTIAFIQQFPLS
jgi:histidine ammonia-lyase